MIFIHYGGVLKVNGLLAVSQYFWKYPFFDGWAVQCDDIYPTKYPIKWDFLHCFSSIYFHFPLLQWNGSTTYDFAIERDFGTDYGICCWYTPQHNLTEVQLHQERNNLSEPDWGKWFQNLPKVTLI